MDYQELVNALKIEDDGLTINKGTLTPNIDSFLTNYYADQAIVITNAKPGPGNGVNEQVVISGNSSFLNVHEPAVLATFSLDEQGNAQALLQYTLLGDTPPSGHWLFSDSFPNMPNYVWTDANYPPSFPASLLLPGDGEPSPLDTLNLSDASFVVTSMEQKEPTYQIDLKVGINFVSQLHPNEALGIFENLVGNTGPLPFYGTIHIPTQTETTVPLEAEQYPWEAATPVPGINLQADMQINQSLEQMTLDQVLYRIYIPASTEWLKNNPTYQPLMAYTGTLSIPSASVAAELTAVIDLETDSVLLRGKFNGVTVAKMANMVNIAGTSDLIGSLPDQIKSLGDNLGQLELMEAGISLTWATTTGITIDATSFTIGMPNLKWHVWDNAFEIASIVCRFAIAKPFSAPSTTVILSGKFLIEGVPCNIVASTADNFTVYAELAESQTIPLNSLMATYAPSVPPPSDLTVNALNVTVAPFNYYTMQANLAQQPTPWVIDVGPESFTVSNVTLFLNYPKNGPLAGSFGGSIAFADEIFINILYNLPGDVVIRALLPDINLTKLIAEMSNQSLQLPSGFDLHLTDSSILIQKQGTNYVFQLGTQVDNLGSFAFQAQRVGDQWGFAVGLDLSLGKPSGVPGLDSLALFQDFFQLQKFLLVVSSFDNPSFTFPDLGAFDNPNITAKNIPLPAQAGGLIQGLNVFAEWSLDQSQEQSLLKGLLGLSPSLGITLQVGADPAQNSKLFINYHTTIQGLPLACQFGGQIAGSEIRIFLFGSMQVAIQGQAQTFDVTLFFVENGAFMSGTMKGGTAVDFGTFKLANLALEIGVDWEGIPSLGVAATIDVAQFESSIAVFFDSADPSKSLVAGSLSSLTLGDVVDALAGDVIPSDIDAVLKEVALQGTNTFTIPANLATDLDNLKLDTVAAAFGSHGVTIPSSSTQTLLVVNTPGSRWYLTDMTTMRHYELVNQSQEIQVSLSPQFYFAPQETYIGSIKFPQDFYVNAALDLFGFHASAEVSVSINQGIAADVAIDPISVAGTDFFQITGSGGVGGPQLSMASFARNNQPAHFYLDGEIRFLGLDLQEHIDITTSGFVFDIKGDLVSLVVFDLNGHFQGINNFGAGGTVTIGFQDVKLDLGFASGPIVLDTNATGTLEANYDGNTATANFEFSFNFQGQVFEVAKFDLDVHTGPLSDIWSIVKDKIENRLLHADITLHIDNIVQEHLDQAGSQHIDNKIGDHIDSSGPWGHQDQGGSHQDQAGTDHLDHAPQHQDQYYHADNGVETKIDKNT